MKRTRTVPCGWLSVAITALVACGSPVAIDGGADARPDATVPQPDAPGADAPATDAPGVDAPQPGDGAGPDVDPSDAPATDAGCLPPRVACGAACVDLQSDPAHCGRCGAACPAGMSCAAGACGAECRAPNVVCAGSCVNPQSDPAHCGACGAACAAGQRCVAGVCRSDCPAPRVTCGPAGMTSCVDTQSDANHCGACDAACPAGQSCVAGTCRLACAAPLVACGAGVAMACVDTQSSPAHCGACGVACPAGQACARGACTAACVAPNTVCGASCVNTQTDAAHCGACGAACPGGQACVAGVCRLPCGAPNTVCGAGAAMTCVDLRSSPTNCGACGNACGAGRACVAGACALVCPAGQTACGAAGCVDTQTDAAHCGACGVACPAGQSCAAGVCRLGCAPPNTVCGAGAGMVCVNVATAVAHCGRCGNACAAGQRCVAGACTAPPPANDTRAGAIPISLGTYAQTLTATTEGAASDTTSPCGGGCGTAAEQPDVFYIFALGERSIVYADTFGTAHDTQLFLQTSAGATVVADAASGSTTCSNDGCATTQSQLAAVLNPGTYYLVLAGCRGGRGPATIHFQYAPAGSGGVQRIMPSTTMQSDAAAVSGTSGVGAICGTAGPEDALFYTTCPSFASQVLHASTCGGGGTHPDPMLHHRSLNGLNVCNDDAGFACGAGASLTATVPAGAALHVLYEDSAGTAGGTYTVNYRFGCNAGFTLCGGACVETSRFMTDEANCGGCGITCPGRTTCVAGICRPVNDACANASAITLLPSGQTTAFGSDSTNATQDTATDCPGENPTVWYRFTLAVPSVVYADTLATARRTRLGFNASCSDPPTGCVDASCGTGQSQTMAVLSAGTHYLQVGGYAGSAGPFTVRMQHVPVTRFALSPNVAGPSAGALPAGPIAQTGTTAMTLQVAASTCGPASLTQGRWYHWMTCPSYAGGAFNANTCNATTAFDTVLALAHGSGSPPDVCNDNGAGAACTGGRSSLAATVPAGAGIHVLTVRAASTSAGGMYSIAGTRP